MPDEKSSVCTRDKILEAARGLFAERGFRGTTTAGIAARAGINEALIYRHFPAKKDLYAAILRARLDDETMVSLLRTPDCVLLPPEEALRLLADRFFRAFDPIFLRLYYHSALEGHELARDFYEQFTHRFQGAIEEILRRGVEQGRFRPLDPFLTAQAFIAMFRSYALTKELFPQSSPWRADAEVIEAFCGIFLRGIQA